VPVLDDAVIDRLADIAKTPEARREQFATSMRKIHGAAWKRGKDWKPTRKSTNRRRRGRPNRPFKKTCTVVPERRPLQPSGTSSHRRRSVSFG
jgi:hypothetical protein